MKSHSGSRSVAGSLGYVFRHSVIKYLPASRRALYPLPAAVGHMGNIDWGGPDRKRNSTDKPLH